jgi:microcystin-dependent protein
MDLPSGVVIAFAGSQDRIPTDWHHCDGTELDAREHTSLFNAIGTMYGGNGNPKFNLPDYQGYFLRAANTSRPDGPDYGRSVGTPPQRRCNSETSAHLRRGPHNGSGRGGL